MGFIPQTQEQLEQLFLNFLLSYAGAPVTDYNIGSVIRLLGSSESMLQEEFNAELLEQTAQAIQTIPYNMTNFSPLPAVYAYGQVQFSNSNSNDEPLSSGSLFTIPNSAIQYQLASSVTVPANGNVTAVVTCTVAGSVGNAPANTITQFVNPVTGVTVSNQKAFRTGADAETEDQRIARFQNFLNLLHRGDKGAVEAGSLTSAIFDPSGYITEQVTRAVALQGSLLANPSAAPALAHVAAGTALAAGSYDVGYTIVTSNGETMISPLGAVTLIAGDEVQVSPIALPSGASSINYYLSTAAGSTTVAYASNGTGAQINLTTLPASGAKSPPAFNNAVAPIGGTGTVFVYNGSGPMSTSLLSQTQNVINGYTDAQGVRHTGYKPFTGISTAYDSYENPQTVTMGIYPLPGYTLSQLQGPLQIAIQNVFDGLDVGDPLRAGDLAFACRNVTGVGNAVPQGPATDLPGVIGQIYVLSGTPTFNPINY